MIPYIEIIDKYTLKRFAQIEPNECWFEISYFEIGEFEIYCRASLKNLSILKSGHYVKVPNKPYCWVITSVKYTYEANGARMIIASGKEAKWLLNKRIIKAPLHLPQNIGTAVNKLINDNLGVTAHEHRKINGFVCEEFNIEHTMLDTQAPRGNLSEYVLNLLKLYGLGSQVIYENNTLKHKILLAEDKTAAVKFSQSLDNLLSSSYSSNDEDYANTVLVVSTVDEVDYTQEYDLNVKGVDRAEVLVNSNLSTKYTDANGVEQETTPTSSLYQSWLVEEGFKEAAKRTVKVEVDGVIDLQNSLYNFEEDFKLGDIVEIKDEYFNFSFQAMILKYTFKQDAKGYGEEATYGGGY